MRSINSMFSYAERVGSRPKDWKIKPTSLRRQRVRSFSPIFARSCPKTRTVPLSGRSSPPKQLSSVVFPLPERPFSAINSPGGICRLTPRRACTSRVPDL